MSAHTTNVPISHHINANEIDQLFTTVWEMAARQNPMVLVNMSDPHTAIEHLRDVVRDCLGKGLSAIETQERALKQLLNFAVNAQRVDTSKDLPSQHVGETPSRA